MVVNSLARFRLGVRERHRQIARSSRSNSLLCRHQKINENQKVFDILWFCFSRCWIWFLDVFFLFFRFVVGGDFALLELLVQMTFFLVRRWWCPRDGKGGRHEIAGQNVLTSSLSLFQLIWLKPAATLLCYVMLVSYCLVIWNNIMWLKQNILLIGGLEDFFVFPYIGNNHPNWLIFFRGVETTNHISILLKTSTSRLLNTWPTCTGTGDSGEAVRLYPWPRVTQRPVVPGLWNDTLTKNTNGWPESE